MKACGGTLSDQGRHVHTGCRRPFLSRRASSKSDLHLNQTSRYVAHRPLPLHPLFRSSLSSPRSKPFSCFHSSCTPNHRPGCMHAQDLPWSQGLGCKSHPLHLHAGWKVRVQRAWRPPRQGRRRSACLHASCTPALRIHAQGNFSSCADASSRQRGGVRGDARVLAVGCACEVGQGTTSSEALPDSNRAGAAGNRRNLGPDQQCTRAEAL